MLGKTISTHGVRHVFGHDYDWSVVYVDNYKADGVGRIFNIEDIKKLLSLK